MPYQYQYHHSNQNTQKEPSPTRALWRHVFFIERVLQEVALKAYGTPEEFQKAFAAVAGRGDAEMLINNMNRLAGTEEDDRNQSQQVPEGLPFR